MNEPAAPTEAQRKRSWLAYAPLAFFAALTLLFLSQLFFGNPTKLPSALIGKPAPAFALPPVDGMQGPGLANADLKKGEVTLVNVFASWCVPCHQEHPVLMRLAKDPELAKRGVKLVGLAYKDEPENTRRFLGQDGNPYAAIGMDRSGRVGIDWGVYGVPETFVVRGDGIIAYKFVGPMSEEAFATRRSCPRSPRRWRRAEARLSFRNAPARGPPHRP
jgi:cytochrome c biogenesis protein CcmG/thiol:disulfide interchange protein DsbE